VRRKSPAPLTPLSACGGWGGSRSGGGSASPPSSPYSPKFYRETNACLGACFLVQKYLLPSTKVQILTSRSLVACPSPLSAAARGGLLSRSESFGYEVHEPASTGLSAKTSRSDPKLRVGHGGCAEEEAVLPADDETAETRISKSLSLTNPLEGPKVRTKSTDAPNILHKFFHKSQTVTHTQNIHTDTHSLTHSHTHTHTLLKRDA